MCGSGSALWTIPNSASPDPLSRRCHPDIAWSVSDSVCDARTHPYIMISDDITYKPPPSLVKEPSSSLCWFWSMKMFAMTSSELFRYHPSGVSNFHLRSSEYEKAWDVYPPSIPVHRHQNRTLTHSKTTNIMAYMSKTSFNFVSKGE